MQLTDTRARNAKSKDSPYKLTDGDGMYLLVQPNGSKYWRLKYRVAGKEKVLALGVYPEVSLTAARKRRVQAREQVAGGADPMIEKKAAKRAEKLRASNTFGSIALEWWESRCREWSPAHTEAVKLRIDRELSPLIGDRPIAEITAPEVLDVIRGIERRGHYEVAAKSITIAGQVFRYAVATHRVGSDPTRDLRGALKRREVNHYARLKDAELPEFMRKLEAYDGAIVTKIAMKLLALTFVRTAELRLAQWTEFDLDKREWRVPAERMKSRREHIVPLSRQAIQALGELRTFSGHRENVFPNEHRPLGCMSENTILYALYRMGYRGKATGHGFRGTASTILNEHGFHADVIERQLAHVEGNQVRAAYNYAQYLPERRRMMQWWADYLDAKRDGAAKVIPLDRRA